MTGTTPIDTIIQGDCLGEMKRLPDRSIDAIVTDPPYELAFMGKKWDASGIAYNVDMWGECLRVLKPGGHLLAFGGSRTYHRMACAIEDAGFEIRDSIHWAYSQGFPKSLSIERAIDKMEGKNVKSKYLPDPDNKIYGSGKCKAAGVDRTPGAILNYPPQSDLAKRWAGWGSALKPAHEPVVLARKPLDGCTIAENVLRWGCGGLNVDGCRISTSDNLNGGGYSNGESKGMWTPGKEGGGFGRLPGEFEQPMGRFPSDLIHDASPAVLAEFAKAGKSKSRKGAGPSYGKCEGVNEGWKRPSHFAYNNKPDAGYIDEGTPARFFMACEFTEEDIPAFLYYAKASKSDRGEGNTHSTVKPTSLIQYLARLSCPPGGIILDPFGGSGTLAVAAIREGFHYILIEKEPEYIEICKSRIAAELKKIGPKQLDLSESFKSDDIHM